MARTTPISSGWTVLVRPLGTISPGAVATISTCPMVAQATASTKNRMMTPPIARPAGEAGVSMISRAAGRNSSSSRRRRRRATGRTGPTADSDDFMKARLGAMQHGIAPALADQLVVTAVLDDPATLDGDDAIG